MSVEPDHTNEDETVRDGRGGWKVSFMTNKTTIAQMNTDEVPEIRAPDITGEKDTGVWSMEE